jgi:hypothetical protein
VGLVRGFHKTGSLNCPTVGSRAKVPFPAQELLGAANTATSGRLREGRSD